MSSPENMNQSADPKIKLTVLAKAYKEEKKKVEEMEKELIQLRESVVVKQERIDKLKEELIKYREDKTPKNIQTFVKGFFDEDKENTENEVDDEKVKLEMENENLQKEIEKIEKEKEILNNELNKLKKENEEYKKSMEKKIEDNKTNNDTKINKIKEEYENQIKTIKMEIYNKNQSISEQNKCINRMSELCKSFDVQKFELDKEIMQLKNENESLKLINETNKKDIVNLQNNQNDLSKNILDYTDQIRCFKEEINQYKKIIEELTPIRKNYLFKGKVLVYENELVDGFIEASFENEEYNLWIRLTINNVQEEIVILGKDIKEAITDNNKNCRVWFSFNAVYNEKSGKKKILCEFSSKEVKYFIQFCKEYKKFSDHSIFNYNYDNYFY